MTVLPLLIDRALPDVLTGPGVLTCVQGNLPLVAMDVDADLTGLLAGMTVRQTFHNPHRTPIEATYVFPLPDRAAVTGLTVTIGERRIIGRIEERQAARDVYDAAIEAGQRAAIVEEERPDVFTTRIGNLAPGEEAIISLTLAGAVPCEFGEATFRVPLVVAPRYVAGNPLDGGNVGDGVALDTDAVPDASRITPPVLLPGMANPVRLSVRVTIDPAGLEVADLRSSLHTVTVAGSLPGHLTVELRPGERLNRDFILRYRVGAAEVGVTAIGVVDADGGEGTFVVTVTPPAAAGTPAPRDVVLVLDRSGSMGGWKMVAARRAAARIIDALTGADRFSVMAFDTVVERPPGADASQGLVPATDRNRYQAIEWLARLEARGGTEMLEPLSLARQALQGGGDGGRYACCILVTDGQVANEDQLVAAVGGMRVFAVGIDQAVNAGLLHRLAGVNGGRCDLVESEDRLDQVMTDLQRGIANPVFQDASVRFEGVEIVPGSLTPPGPVDVFAGVPRVISGRFRGPAAAAGRAVVEVGGRTLSAPAPVVAVANPAAAPVWARSHLRDLEDRYVAGRGRTDSEALAAEITAVSLRHRVLCRFTAFVAVDESGLPVGGDLHRIVQPVEVPGGWHRAPASFAGAVPMRAAYAAGAPGSPPPPLQVGPPFAAPGYPPAPPVDAPPPMRAGRRPLTPSGKPIAAPPPSVSLLPDRYRPRLEALLAGVDKAGADVARLAEDARQLAEDLGADDGGGSGPVVEALGALVTALSAGDLAGTRVAAGRVRAVLGWNDRSRGGEGGRRGRFWR